jgi:hypothetical protein
MDFSFYIQNFSTVTYNRIVKPNHEATLAYSFIPAEAFAGRPFGLNVNLNYKDLVSLLIIYHCILWYHASSVVHVMQNSILIIL